MKKILGLDIGTNSIGSALISTDEDSSNSKIIYAGDRIIPMPEDQIQNFNKGDIESAASARTSFRSARKRLFRHILRRQRLHKVLNVLGFLPDHYVSKIDFTSGRSDFYKDEEPKIAWQPTSDGKYRFLFMDSYAEMVALIKAKHPDFGKIPLDWTVYYLRKKALSQKISKEELAWILLHFNTKRGYYQRGDDDARNDDNKTYECLTIKSVDEADIDSRGNQWYNVMFNDSDLVFPTKVAEIKNMIGQQLELIVTRKIQKDGTVKTSFAKPKEDDWTLVKKRTESLIEDGKQTVGEFIFNAIVCNPHVKVRGKLVSTIERKFYRDELVKILEEQKKHHPELTDKTNFDRCVNILYTNNESHRRNIASQDFTYLFVNEIIFYHRPLKSKKSLIDNCPMEEFVKDDKVFPVKCIAKSNPYYQEFRIWQFITNIHVFQRINDEDVTSQYLNSPGKYAELYDFLNSRKDVSQADFFKCPIFGKGVKSTNFRWNYIDDDKKKYPCNETRATILAALSKAGFSHVYSDKLDELTSASASVTWLYRLWHIMYSVTDPEQFSKALLKFAKDFAHNEDEQSVERFVTAFKSVKPFESSYGAFSEKAIKKLLPLMRYGKYWREEAIDSNTRIRIERILSGEADDSICEKVREDVKKRDMSDISHFQGLPTYLASYVVYNRHSEPKSVVKWESPDDLNHEILSFKHGSLRNPVVENVILETLRVVRDIWKKYGDIDEIHVEMGREMRLPNDKRRDLTIRNLENERTNLRIKALLTAFLNPELEVANDNNEVRPFSPSHQERLKLYEKTVFEQCDIPDEIDNILKKFAENDVNHQPSKSEINQYRLWLDQQYKSPYTGRPIPLSRLFSNDYEIDHIIPQSVFFDDSFNNKVICETSVNKEKSNKFGIEFIRSSANKQIELGGGKTVRILSVDEYTTLVNSMFANNKRKRDNLLRDDVPEEFVSKKLNDTRYITRLIVMLLSNVVRSKDDSGRLESEAISKNVIPCNGEITSRLKQDWGIFDVWNDIISPRFERMNKIDAEKRGVESSDRFGKKENNKFLISVPLDLQKGFQKKRIDHRHHTMDALVIACANRNIVNYLNNSNAHQKDARIDLRNSVCYKDKAVDGNNYKWRVKKPWPTYTQDVKAVLEKLVVSFKKNNRVLTPSTNFFDYLSQTGEKRRKKQNSDGHFAIRRQLHKDTVYGKVNMRNVVEKPLSYAVSNADKIVDKELRNFVKFLLVHGYKPNQIKKEVEEKIKETDTKKIEMYNDKEMCATRKPLDTSFDKKKILSITDSGIRQILLRHLINHNNNSATAFSPEGIAEMNSNIITLNNGRFHLPIFKVRISEEVGLKFPVGRGKKSSKYVEAAKGTNLYYAVYVDKKGKRKEYVTMPLRLVIERLKNHLSPAPEISENGNTLLFSLSPNDLVYVPRHGEDVTSLNADNLDKSRIFKVVKFTKQQLFLLPFTVASTISKGVEYGASDVMEMSPDGNDSVAMRHICIPLSVDRLGNISFR